MIQRNQHMTVPEISVVIPCYNAARYVAAAVRSALAQRTGSMEIIVVDDGSSDGSAQVVRQQFSSVDVVEQPNLGVAAARNAGIRRARGEWIAFLDADDVWLPGKIAAQRRLLADMPAARMVYTAWHVWESCEPEPSPGLLHTLSRGADDNGQWRGASGWIYPELLVDCVVWTSTVLAHRSLFDEAGLFDPSLRIGEDYDLWLRVSRVTPILRVCAPFALYRMNASSITRQLPERNYRSDVVRHAVRRWGYGSPDGRLANRSEVNRGLAGSWIDYAGAHLAAGSLSRARQGALSALRADPSHLTAWKVLARSFIASTRNR